MNDIAKRNLRNVIVFSLVDGKLTDGEKKFIDALRARSGISADEFRELCDQVRQDRKRISLPRGGKEAEEVVRLLVQAAMADGQVSAEERSLLGRLAEHVGLGISAIEQLLSGRAGGKQADDAELQARMDEIYKHFVQWDAPTRRERIQALGALGPHGVIALLRIMESYRAPDGAPNGLELTTLVAEQLGRIGDRRAIYYLAQQVSIGDSDDEITNAALRFAAAEAMGRILGEPFSADQRGVLAARAWWLSAGRREYDRLAF